MDARLEKILTLVIEDFIATAEPVGSQALVNQHQLDVSPATVRNWFADLVEQGMLVQPHTSAGRIPSEAAYRWYVETQLGEPSINKRDQLVLERIAQESSDTDRKIKAAAKACANTAGVAAIVGTNASDSYYTGLTELFQQPEFRDWSRVVTMSAVLDKLDDQLAKLRRVSYQQPTILIGEQCPFGNACSTVLVTLPDASLLALLGPIRMPYRETRNLLSAVVSVFT
jgi:transcriptional regulator of heat shock response